MFSVPTTDLEAYADGLVRKINAKLEQLQIEGVTTHDEEIIESGRLKFVWDDPVQFSAITTWRHRRARSAYTKVQNANAHLFLAMVLAVTPTDCAKTRFEGVLDHILRWNDIKACHFRLSVEARKLFESVAAQQGYSGSCGYLSFMKGLFPPDRYQAGERRRQRLPIRIATTKHHRRNTIHVFQHPTGKYWKVVRNYAKRSRDKRPIYRRKAARRKNIRIYHCSDPNWRKGLLLYSCSRTR